MGASPAPHAPTLAAVGSPIEMGCPLCGNKPMLSIMVVSSLVFLATGAAFFAPYWLFDGTSFMLSSILGYLAVQQGSSNGYATATCSVAAISVLVEVGFLIAALILWNEEMNPIHRTSYGEKGNSFFFCSLYSSILNVFVVFHFKNLEGPIQSPETPSSTHEKKLVTPEGFQQ